MENTYTDLLNTFAPPIQPHRREYSKIYEHRKKSYKTTYTIPDHGI